MSSKSSTLFDRGVVAPWQVFSGDLGGWQTPMTGAVSTSPNGVLTLRKTDHLVQEDAMRATWNGKGVAQAYLQANAVQDWSAFAKENKYLSFNLKVLSRPSADVVFRLDCVWPCSATTDITKLMKAAPLDKWVRATIDIKCLEKAGLDAAKVETGFLISSQGKLDIAFSYVSIAEKSDEKPTIGCD
jgi:beta-glucosidase